MTASTWMDLLRGHYAAKIHHHGQHIGWALFHRQTPHTTRAGNTTGRDRFTVGAKYATSKDQARTIRDLAPTRHLEWLNQVLAAPEAARSLYSIITGRCGVCNRELTDPMSKLFGIGPECRRDTAPREMA